MATAAATIDVLIAANDDDEFVDDAGGVGDGSDVGDVGDGDGPVAEAERQVLAVIGPGAAVDPSRDFVFLD